MQLPFIKKINTEKETIEIAKEFSKILEAGKLITLKGNLGSGKTFFVKEVAKAFGYSDATSPTFAIVNEYPSSPKIFHFDFYRIKSIEELYNIGFDEYLSDETALTFIEWADMFQEVLPSKYIQIEINRTKDLQREIKIVNVGD